MKYYSINNSDDLKTIGYYPQTELSKEYKSKVANSLDSHWKMRYDAFQEFLPSYSLKLHKKAIATDYLSGYDLPFGFLVNLKLRRILEDYNLPPHKFYPIKVFHNKKELNYYWFHYYFNIWDYVDFEKSTALIMKKFDFKIDKVIPVPNLENINNFKLSLSFDKELMINELFFKDNFPGYDIFLVDKVQHLPIILSEKLIKRFEKEEVTGYEKRLFEKIKE
ncbi:imm11 family protein [Tenacibaculum maritimum]|uniref:imm11 family protein n=1 Tax=Tenacibaculum maritimum TaxID=107401 RepID=UPI0010A47C71|nr:DUF1629 domain-containing protein [Tenacibaculum maritimum]QCD61433.1 hypothetical protein B9C57_02230 [Tenacibaculum maritimum]